MISTHRLIIKLILQKCKEYNSEAKLDENEDFKQILDSKITMIANSGTLQRDELILTELRNMREYKRNPEKYIFMLQGITSERGGLPFTMIHTKYLVLICQ